MIDKILSIKRHELYQSGNFQILLIVYAAIKLTMSIYYNCNNW